MVEANAWFDSSLKGLGKGERSICNWDEDTITMAVEAGYRLPFGAAGQIAVGLEPCLHHRSVC